MKNRSVEAMRSWHALLLPRTVRYRKEPAMPFLSSLKTRLRQNRSVQQSRKELLLDLDAAAIRLQEATRYFDAVSDEALVVSAIHELESASARYRALLKQARELQLSRPFWEAQAMARELSDWEWEE